MKRILQSLITIVLLCFSISAFAQQTIQYTLKYNTVSSEYEVYMKSNINGPNNLMGSCGVTVVMPTSIPDNPINPINLAGGAWGDNSTIYADPSEPTHDYHNFSTSGSNSTANTYVANTEKLLFKFSLPGGCVAGIRLYENTTDTNGMGGGDWVNYCELGTVPLSDKYISNYNNTGVSCAPATAPDLVTTIGQPLPSLVAGQPSTVPVTVTNIGTAPTTGVITTTITLPTGTSAPTGPFVTNGNTCTTSGQTVTCTNPGPLTTTAPSNSTLINVPVTAAPSTVGTNPGPFAATPSTPGETTTGNNPAPPMTPTNPVVAAPAPNIVIAIGQPSPNFVAGSPSNVPVTVTNIGTAPETGSINSTITLPTGFSAPASFSPVVGTTCTTTGQAVTCVTAGPLSNTTGSNTATFNIPVTPAASTVGTTPTTTASVSSPNEPVANQGDNNATPMTPTTPVSPAAAPDLVTTIGQPSPSLVAGQPSNIPVTVTNIGTAPTTGVITTSITLPTGTSAPATFTSNGNTCTTVGQTVTCTNPGPLSTTSPTNSTIINVPVTAAPSTVGTNPGPFTATPSTPGETVTANNPAVPMTPTNPVTAATAPDLVTTIGAVSPAMIVGQTSNLPVTITNIGTAPTTGTVTTTITLPAGVSTQPLFVTNGYTCSTSGQTVTCFSNTPLSNVAPNNAALLQIPITPAASTVNTTPVFNANTSGGGEPVGSTTNNAAPPTTSGVVSPVPAPDLVTTIGQPSPSLVAGQPSTVPVTVTNIGNAPTTGVITTTITLPTGTSAPAGPFVTNGNTCTTSGQTVTCTNPGPLTTTAPSNSTVINIPVTAAPSTVGTNPGPFAATPSTPGETTTGNNTAPPMTPTNPVSAAPAPDLVTTIGQPATPFVAGTPSNMPVTVTNIGTLSATGPITTTITLPVGFSAPASFPSNGNTCTTSGQVVSCTHPGPLSNIAPGNSLTIQVPVTPAASTIGTTPTTTATTNAPNEPVTSQGNNNATPMSPTTPVAAAPAPDLVTVIGQPTTPFVAGTPSTVPVTVTNIGTSPTTGVITTTITLPTGTSAPAGPFVTNGNTCTTSGQIVTCTNPGPLSNLTPNNSTVMNIPVTAATSTVGTNPGPFAATPSTSGETTTGNNPAPPMTPTTPVAPAAVVNVKLNVKLFLQGAYDNATGLMRDDLRARGFLPTAQPYSAMARTAYHTGTETTTVAAFAATGSNAIVDWVLLELRTGTTAATRVATRAALVQRDGDVVDVDGVSPVTFNNRAAGAYYIVATHRNHLGVMSEVAVSMSATATTCDFTGAYDGFGTYAQKSIGNLNALWAGNVTHTGITHKNLIFSGANNDPDGVKNDVLTAPLNTAFNNSYVPTGYKLGDTNLDGDVKYQGPSNDVDNFIFFNVIPFPLNTANSALYIMSEQH